MATSPAARMTVVTMTSMNVTPLFPRRTLRQREKEMALPIRNIILCGIGVLAF